MPLTPELEVEYASQQISTMSTIDNAVTFLRDPNVQSAPNEKKLAFLQAKGLNQPEIDEAMRLSAVPSYNPATATMNYRNRQAQLQNQRDWRDWFIMTIVGGSVAWLGMSLARVSSCLYGGAHNTNCCVRNIYCQLCNHLPKAKYSKRKMP